MSEQYDPQNPQNQPHNNGQTSYGNYGQTPPMPENGQPNFGQQSYQQQGYQQPGFNQAPPTFDAYGNPIPSDAKMLSVLSHLSSIVLYIVTASALSFLGPLIFWLIYKDKPNYQFVAVSSARAFNFNFTMWIINVIGWVFAIITFGFGMIIAFPLTFITGILTLIFHIIAAVKANNGEVYNYPMQIKILKA